ncbi:hypothetical protein D3C80_1884570 [compost metagenome]
MFFYQSSQPLQCAFTLLGGLLRPATIFKRCLCGGDGNIHILRITLGDLSNFLTGGRVQGRKCFTTDGINEFSVDKSLCPELQSFCQLGEIRAGMGSHESFLW